MNLPHNGFTKIFIALIKISFDAHLKHYIFWPSADLKTVQNDLVHSMPDSA